MGSPNAPKINKNQAWTSKCPFLCSPLSQDRPRVLQDAKVKPPSMQNNRFGYQKCQDPHENWSQGHPKSWKMEPGIMRMPTSTKIDFCNTPLIKCLVFNPGHPDSNQKPITKRSLETSITKYTCFNLTYRKSSQGGSLNPTKINRNQSLDLKVSFILLPTVPGSPQGPPRRQSEATKHAK